jgi:F-type H+-transporting ATPase subunit epsilon
MGTTMTLRILLPQGAFCEKADVARIVAETQQGSFGILPHRQDCVAALQPGIFLHQTVGGTEVYTAIDEGILIKTGTEVTVSVRRAIGGSNLADLRAHVHQEFLTLSDEQQSMLTAMAKLEAGLLRRLKGVHHD